MRVSHPPQRQRRCCGGRVGKAFRRPPAVRLRDRLVGYAFEEIMTNVLTNRAAECPYPCVPTSVLSIRRRGSTA